MEIIWEWAHHTVYSQDSNWVVKIPRNWNPISWNQANNSLAFFQEYFSTYMPETHLEKWRKDIPYFVLQKRVHGILLCNYLSDDDIMPSSDILSKLKIFTERAYKIIQDQWRGFDIIGTPIHPKDKRQWSGCTNFMVSPENSELFFIDSIAWSKTLSLPSLVCKIWSKIIPAYKKRERLTKQLLLDLIKQDHENTWP